MNEMAFLDGMVPAPGIKDDAPILSPLTKLMRVELVLHPDSKVWLLHDRPFPDYLLWAEYDVDTASLILVAKGGKIHDLGMKIPPPIRKLLRHSRQLFTMRVQNDIVDDSYILPLIVRETGHYKT